jgi:hypothetical protein
MLKQEKSPLVDPPVLLVAYAPENLPVLVGVVLNLEQIRNLHLERKQNIEQVVP